MFLFFYLWYVNVILFVLKKGIKFRIFFYYWGILILFGNNYYYYKMVYCGVCLWVIIIYEVIFKVFFLLNVMF